MTAERRTLAIAAITTDLEWFKIPHTLDQVVGIYAEASREMQGTRPRSMTNEEILSSITSRGGSGGKGGHSDPTPAAALAGQPDAEDADGTMGSIDAALALLVESADELDRTCCTAMGVTPLLGHRVGAVRQERVTWSATALIHVRPHLEPAIAALDHRDGQHLDELVRYAIAESASHLRTKAEDIWHASKGERRTVAVQRAIVECTLCSAWRSGTIAVSRGRCEQCARFQDHHKCKPTQEIVDHWEVTFKDRLPTEMISRAKRHRAKAS